MDKNIIKIIMYEYGLNKKEAYLYYKTADKNIISELKKGYKKQYKKAFYND